MVAVTEEFMFGPAPATLPVGKPYEKPSPVPIKTPPPPGPIYNPYPPGILPPNLVSEIERVRREVRGIEQQALMDWRALPPGD